MLMRARAEGAFRGAVLVYADRHALPILGDTLRGVLTGPRSEDHPLQILHLRGHPQELLLSNTPITLQLAPAPPVLGASLAQRFLLLPEAELPGLQLRRSVFLGRNAGAPSGGRREGRSGVSLGPLGHADEEVSSPDIFVPSGQLFRHLLVTGTTGSGKTFRVHRIIEGLAHMRDELRVVVFETAKRTYRDDYVRVPGQDPRVYTIGSSQESPLRINPFFFEPGTSLKRHISVVSDALSDLMPTEAMIGPYMRAAVERCYTRLGWDIETGRWGGEGDKPVYPGVIDFAEQLHALVDELGYGGEVNANYRGALLGRAAVFTAPTYQDIFSHDGNSSVDELFPRDTIIEFEQLPASELDLTAFIISILLERLRAWQNRQQQEGIERGWLLVVEEAHNVLGREHEARGSSLEAAGGHTLLKNFVRLLQEGRSLKLGMMVVDQSPSLLARSVVKNTNTKIVMRMEDGEDIEDMGSSLGLDEDSRQDLGVLREGEAVVKTSGMLRPVRSGRWPYVGRSQHRRLRLEAKPPDYRTLEEGWRHACSGLDPRPDDRWLAEMTAAANGSVELLVFCARKVRMELRTGLAEAAPPGPYATGEAVLAYAEGVHATVRHAAVAAALLEVEAHLVRAIAASEWAPPAVTVAGLQFAAEVLAGSRQQDLAGWQGRLADLFSMDPGDWTSACERWMDFARRSAWMDPLAASAALRLASATFLERAPGLATDRTSPAETRLGQVGEAGGLAAPLLACVGAEPTPREHKVIHDIVNQALAMRREASPSQDAST
jgi:hypothetical protein